MKFLFSILLICSASGIFAVDMIEKEKTLVREFKKIKDLPTYEEQFKQSEFFKNELRKVLAYDEAFEHEFCFFKAYMCVAKAPDNKFKIFNWNVEKAKWRSMVWSLILHYNKRKKDV